MQRYENRRAVITGAATGLGQAIAQRLAADLEGPSALERAADALFKELQAGTADLSSQQPPAFSEGLMRLNLG